VLFSTTKQINEIMDVIDQTFRVPPWPPATMTNIFNLS